MLLSSILTFFLTSLLTAGFMILLLPNPIHSLLFLVIIFINAAGILILFNFEFLALLLIILYVGAIAVLFLFILMMIDIQITSIFKTDWFVYIFFMFIFSFLLFFVTSACNYSFLINSTIFLFVVPDIWVNIITEINNCATFGHILYSFYLIYFLLAGLILLVALIGSIFLTQIPTKMKHTKDFNQISKIPKLYFIK